MPDAIRHPIFARFYAWLAPIEDRSGVAEHRRDLVAGLRGRVLEVGVGTGLSFGHYPPEVDQLVAVEPEPTMRANAEKAVGDVALDVQLVHEHVLSPNERGQRVQRALDATVWPRAFGNCHLTRDTGAAIAAAGFEIRELRRFRIGPTPAAPHILGAATSPA